MRKFIAVISTIFVFCAIGSGQKNSNQQNDAPLKISLCELQNSPADYNQKLIEISGFVSHGFEDFSIFDPTCNSHQSIWLEYGGKISSETIYCCGDTAKPNRSKNLVVENFPISLVNDGNFQSLHKLLKRPPGAIVKATISGRFFAGKKKQYKEKISWEGYGHFGCCSLFAIQQVIAVDTTERDDLDFRSTADQPQTSGVGSGFTYLDTYTSSQEVIKLQQKAEIEKINWRFDNPQKVAAEFLAHHLKIDEKQIADIKQTRQTPSRIIYEWKNLATQKDFMIVVSRPYWLSFYAKDSQKVIWTVIAAYEICKKNCE